MSAPRASARPRRAPWRDARVWIGVAVTVGTLWLALRGVSFREVGRELGRANLPLLLGVSVPAYVAMIWLRALRWRHLTDAVQPIARGPLFRATSIGFMANNLFPLRVGEIVRAWYLARESGGRAAPLFGTVVLERVLDALVVIGLAVALFGFRGGGEGSERALAVGVPLVLAALVPIGVVVLLRIAPHWTIGRVGRVAGVVLPRRLTSSLEDLLHRIAEGLASLQGGRHLFWVGLHSSSIWLVLSPIPFVVGLLALGIDLGSPERLLAASYVTLVAVGVAVAVPSAPGFFGPFHWACREALTRFGVSPELAVAVGTLVHAVFWVTVTTMGLVVLWSHSTRLEDLSGAASDAPGKDPSAHRR